MVWVHDNQVIQICSPNPPYAFYSHTGLLTAAGRLLLPSSFALKRCFLWRTGLHPNKGLKSLVRSLTGDARKTDIRNLEDF